MIVLGARFYIVDQLLPSMVSQLAHKLWVTTDELYDCINCIIMKRPVEGENKRRIGDWRWLNKNVLWRKISKNLKTNVTVSFCHDAIYPVSLLLVPIFYGAYNMPHIICTILKWHQKWASGENFLRAFKINSIGIGTRSTFRKRKELPQKSIEI